MDTGTNEWNFWDVEVTGIDEQLAAGVSLRKDVPRSVHGELTVPDRDPVAILEQQHVGRVEDVVPIRVARMAESPFAYYRGAAAVQAHDLAHDARTGVQVLINGDCHLSNFGYFATPERHLTFELNDFDEASEGPWEWDIKRLATSFVLVGREQQFESKAVEELAVLVARAYRISLAALIQLPTLERFYFQPEIGKVGSRLGNELMSEVIAQARRARRRTSERLLEKITTQPAHDGLPRIVDQLPVMYHHHSLADHGEMTAMFDAYRSTLRVDANFLLEQFTLVDAAIRLVGVGSVGTRCGILLLLGPAGHPLFLQFKQAETSVVQQFGGIRPSPRMRTPRRDGEGLRVTNAQRIMQSASDPFLGHFKFHEWDFYMRQFRDMKGSIDPTMMSQTALMDYAQACGALLARGHAQSAGAAVISGYLGKGDTFDLAIGRWSTAYADQAHRDFEAFTNAIATGRLPAGGE